MKGKTSLTRVALLGFLITDLVFCKSDHDIDPESDSRSSDTHRGSRKHNPIRNSRSYDSKHNTNKRRMEREDENEDKLDHRFSLKEEHGRHKKRAIADEQSKKVGAKIDGDIHDKLKKIPVIKQDPTVIITTTTAKPAEEYSPPCGGFEGKRVYILSGDTGMALGRCYLCGPGSSPDSAGVHASVGHPFAVWKLEPIGDKCTLKADSGKYAGRCNGCWRGGGQPDSVFVHIDDPKNLPWAQWKFEKKEDGFALRSDTGRYMYRCNKCVPGGAVPDFAFVHSPIPMKWIIKEAE
jgi:hypothetical protein